MKAFNSQGALIITGVPAGGGGGATFSGGFSTMGNTAGDTGVKTDRLVLVGSNNITLSGSTNAGSITVSILGPAVAGSTLTFFATGNTTQSSSGTLNSTSLILRGSNIVSVGVSNGSLIFDATQSNQAFSAAGGSSAFQTLSFSDNAQASFTNNAGQLAVTNVRLSFSATGNTTQSSTGTINASSMILRGSNIVSVGVSNGSLIFDATTPAQSNQQMTLFATGNTTQSSTGTTNASSVIFRADGIVSVGITGGSIEISATQSNQAFSAAGGSSAFQTLSFSDNAQGSWTNNAGQVGLTNVRISMSATGNTTQSSTGTMNLSAMTVRGDGLVSVGVTGGSIEISAQGLLAGVSTGGNTAGSTGTVSQGNFVLVGSNGITLSQSTGAAGSAATITISGDGLTASSTDVWNHYGASTQSTAIQGASSGVISVFPFYMNEYVSVGVLNLLFSANFTTVGTSSGLQTAGLAVAVYTRNASTLSSIASQSFSWRVSGNNSTYSINQVTSTDNTGYGATAQTSSAGSNISSGYTGVKVVGFPLNTLLSPGNYWMALIGTNSTSSNNVGLTMGFIGAVVATQETAAAPIGSFSSSYSTGQDQKGIFNVGLGSWTSAGSVTMVPVSMNFASITGGGTVVPFAKLWRT